VTDIRYSPEGEVCRSADRFSLLGGPDAVALELGVTVACLVPVEILSIGQSVNTNSHYLQDTLSLLFKGFFFCGGGICPVVIELFAGGDTWRRNVYGVS